MVVSWGDPHGENAFEHWGDASATIQLCSPLGTRPVQVALPLAADVVQSYPVDQLLLSSKCRFPCLVLTIKVLLVALYQFLILLIGQRFGQSTGARQQLSGLFPRQYINNRRNSVA